MGVHVDWIKSDDRTRYAAAANSSGVAGVAFSSSEPEEMTQRVKNQREFPERPFRRPRRRHGKVICFH